LAQLGASRLLEIDTASRRVVRITAGLADVHGVIVVPSLHRVFATATGTNQLVALDETSGAVLYRAATGDYPDGLSYVSSTGQLWISNESGGTETVIDAATGHIAGTVELGGEAATSATTPHATGCSPTCRPETRSPSSTHTPEPSSRERRCPAANTTTA
jgi:DNA-binding beta-propeller fold protein YncE